MEFITESAALSLMQAGGITVVLMNALSVANNGDALAEAGSLSLAISSQYFQTPVYIMTEMGCVITDASIGRELERNRDGDTAQDLLPASLIHAIINEKGTVHREGKEFNIASFIENGYKTPPFSLKFSSFVALDEVSVKEYIKANPSFSRMIGADDAQWQSRETGDGNINYVYVIEGSKGALVVKQGLPYIRCVGESWPLTQVTSLILEIDRTILHRIASELKQVGSSSRRKSVLIMFPQCTVTTKPCPSS